MPAGFAAPELQSSGQATRHMDMFAYGKTVSQVGAQCEPGDAAAAQGAALEGILNQARGQTAAFVGALTAPSSSHRPSAEDATQHPFFTILGATCQRVSKTSCNCICLADSAAGVECSEGHFHCGSCIGWGLCDRLCSVLVCRGRYGLGGGILLFILGSNLGGVGPERGLRGGGRRGWCEE
jgi:hypothetical protein